MRHARDVGRWASHGLSALGIVGIALLASMASPDAIGRAEAVLPEYAHHEPVDPLLAPLPGWDAISVGRDLLANGQRISLDIAYSSLRPEEAAARYRDRFHKAGLHTLFQALPEGGFLVTAVKEDGSHLAVSIHPDEDGSWILPVHTSGVLRPGAERGDLPLPLPASARQLSTYESLDGRRRATSAQYLSPTEPEALGLWYQERLAAAGYEEVGRRKPPPAAEAAEDAYVWQYRRGAENATVTARRLPAMDTTLVYLLYSAPANGGTNSSDSGAE